MISVNIIPQEVYRDYVELAVGKVCQSIRLLKNANIGSL